LLRNVLVDGNENIEAGGFGGLQEGAGCSSNALVDQKPYQACASNSCFAFSSVLPPSR